MQASLSNSSIDHSTEFVESLLSDDSCIKVDESLVEGMPSSKMEAWGNFSHILDQTHQNCMNRIEAIMLLSDSKTVALSQEFQNLAATAVKQSKYLGDLISIAQCVRVGDEEVNIQDISSLLHKTFIESTSCMLEISKQAMLMVYILNDGIKNLGDIEKCIRQIEIINHKTKYLSINATIEAVRAGEAGESFQVVASEVRDLSNDTQRLAVNIRSQVNQMTETLNVAQNILEKVASIDMSGNMLAKEQLDEMMVGLINNSQKIAFIVDDATRISGEFSETARKLITDIQYQDRVRQDLENMHRSLNIVKMVTERLRSTLGEEKANDVHESIQNILALLPPGVEEDLAYAVSSKLPFSEGMESSGSKASDDVELF